MDLHGGTVRVIVARFEHDPAEAEGPGLTCSNSPTTVYTTSPISQKRSKEAGSSAQHDFLSPTEDDATQLADAPSTDFARNPYRWHRPQRTNL